MNKQRGIATGLLYLIGIAVAIGALPGLVIAWDSYTTGLIKQGHDAGESECAAAYKGRDNIQLRAALDRVKELEEAAREAERKHGLATAAIQSKLNKEIANGKAAEQRILADIAAGKLRVRGSAFQTGACPAVGGRSAVSTVGAGAAGSDGTPACKLSRETESAVLAIGREADDTASQLAAAQAVIVQDRLTCN